MTVRLGAVTKRLHAEATFSALGHFWGRFSLHDLVITDWLTMTTEFIGMTTALSILIKDSNCRPSLPPQTTDVPD